MRGEVNSPMQIVPDQRGSVKSAMGWFRLLWVHCQWPLFEAIRYALWLSR